MRFNASEFLIKVLRVVELSGMKERRFAKAAKIGETVISEWKRKEKAGLQWTPSSDIVDKIIEFATDRVPGVTVEWLLRGIGPGPDGVPAAMTFSDPVPERQRLISMARELEFQHGKDVISAAVEVFQQRRYPKTPSTEQLRRDLLADIEEAKQLRKSIGVIIDDHGGGKNGET